MDNPGCSLSDQFMFSLVEVEEEGNTQNTGKSTGQIKF